MLVCMHGCMYAWLCVCMFACMYGWMDVWMDGCVCMHAWMYVWLYVCIIIRAYIQPYILYSYDTFHTCRLQPGRWWLEAPVGLRMAQVARDSISIYLSIDLSIYPFIHLSVYLSIHPSIHLSMWLYVDASMYGMRMAQVARDSISIYLSMYLFYLSIDRSIHPSIHLSIYIDIC